MARFIGSRMNILFKILECVMSRVFYSNGKFSPMKFILVRAEGSDKCGWTAVFS